MKLIKILVIITHYGKYLFLLSTFLCSAFIVSIAGGLDHNQLSFETFVTFVKIFGIITVVSVFCGIWCCIIEKQCVKDIRNRTKRKIQIENKRKILKKINNTY